MNSPTNHPANQSVVTRFAPSPTGQLHIGGARTALFAWAYAKKHAGQFILRIEDTDQTRSTPQATCNIIEGLQWLGLDWQAGPDPQQPLEKQLGDTGPYFQSQRLDTYRQYIQQLIDMGRAYKCFKTPDELNAARQQAKSEKRAYKYDSTESRNLTPDQIAECESAGKPSVIRFRMPDADVTFHDAVFGDVTVKSSELEDFIIQKTDGFPTFHLAVTIDDATMGVTHVIRGQDHLYNTPKHVALLDALGLTRPDYAHLPLIFNSDGSKMSKRDKAKTARAAAKAQNIQSVDDATGVSSDDLSAFLNKKTDDINIAFAIADTLKLTLPEIDVEDFRRSGYLPDVLLGYISQLGWSHGHPTERYGLDYIVEKFALADINKSNAKFDRDKLAKFNTEAITALPPDEFRELWKAHCARYEPAYLEKLDDAAFALLATSYQERSRTLQEPCDNGQFFIIADDAIEYDAKAVKKFMAKNDGEGFTMLRTLRPALEALDDFTAAPIHALIERTSTEQAVGMGKIAQPLRVAMTGSSVSPPIDQTLAILGKPTVLARIDRCLNVLAETAESNA